MTNITAMKNIYAFWDSTFMNLIRHSMNFFSRDSSISKLVNITSPIPAFSCLFYSVPEIDYCHLSFKDKVTSYRTKVVFVSGFILTSIMYLSTIGAYSFHE